MIIVLLRMIIENELGFANFILMAQKKEIQIIPFENKKDAQELQDIRRSPEERWLYMWELIRFCVLFSPTGKLKEFSTDDKFVTLERKWN